MRGKMIYGYVRVSTKGQEDGHSIEAQQQEILKRYPAAEIICEIVSSVRERELFSGMLNGTAAGDLVVVTALDRFCRSVKEGLEYIDLLRGKEVSLHIMNMGMVDDTIMGRLIVTNLLAFAEFERAMIVERTQRGKAIARQNPGYREGRPRKFGREQIAHALTLLDTHSYKAVSEMTGISKSTLIRAKGRTITI